jgi:hypothetical protein
MTNEEAIEWLERVITLHEVEDMNVTLTDRREYEALDLAIKALKENERLSLLYSDMANETARLKSMTGEMWRNR